MTNTMSRRSMLARTAAGTAAAALPVAAFGNDAAQAAPDDPIYAAIECHRAAWQEFSAKTTELSDTIWYHQQVMAAGRAAELRCVPETPEADAENDRLNLIVNAAGNKLAKMKPTTMAGAIAMLRYANDVEDYTIEIDLSSLADALAAIDGRQS
jgi:hypothetical protein